MNVRWTDAALAHLDAIHAYIAQDSPVYARRTVDRLTGRSRKIAEVPRSRRRVPEYDLDQIRQVIEGPYRMICHIGPDRIDVLAVIHGARNVLSGDDQER
ncbi:MAG: type II toxin-antitoxin system RelE/ParE family toxin [Planctomycetota bacterium]